MEPDHSGRVRYYIVCHRAQQIVWLEEQGPSDLLLVDTEISPQLLFGVLYWMHIRTFPNHLNVTQSFVANVVRLMNFFVTAPSVDPSLARDFPFPFELEKYSIFRHHLRLILSNLTFRASDALGNRYIAAIAYCICDHYYRIAIGLIPCETLRIPSEVLSVLGAGDMRDSPGFIFA